MNMESEVNMLCLKQHKNPKTLTIACHLTGILEDDLPSAGLESFYAAAVVASINVVACGLYSTYPILLALINICKIEQYTLQFACQSSPACTE